MTDFLDGAVWELGSCAPGTVLTPADLATSSIDWMPATVPGTVAGALMDAKRTVADIEAEDWWFRTRVPTTAGKARLLTGGIATCAELWVDNDLVLSSENMFRSHQLELMLGEGETEITIRCAALKPLIAARRARPRWKSYMVTSQNLRWLRTSLLGRIPGWAEIPVAVGPWRPIGLVSSDAIRPEDWQLQSHCDGNAGVLEVSLRLTGSGGPSEPVVVSAAGVSTVLEPMGDDDQTQLCGQLRIENVQRWWPHTHGQPHRYAVTAELDGQVQALGSVGFRTVETDRDGDGFAILVNGERIFTRGACWLPPDPVTLQAGQSRQRGWLELARDANMNMVRVPGTSVYPDRAFYESCDELGLLVWQDCMFAFLDPPDDERFTAEVKAELAQLFRSLSGHASLAVVCGNQEIEEIAAMNGLPREQWATRLADQVIPDLLNTLLPGTPYVSSNPTGGTLPFQMNAGVCQYFGVGGYMRELDDARRSGVRFAAECMAFATPPEPATVDALCGGARAAGHDRSWKQALHHDAGRSWDMDDVRDHYVRKLFGVDPLHARYTDPERALELGRAANAELMSAVFAEWRRPASVCDGGLVLALGDLRPGAGWGLVDALGRPKAPWYALRRVFAPVALLITDEGLNGLDLHLVNDRGEPLQGEVRLELFTRGEVRVESAVRAVTLPPRGGITLEAAGMLDGFRDISYAYRFAPPAHDLVVGTLYDQEGLVVSQAVQLPLGQQRALESDLGLRAKITRTSDGDSWELRVSTRRFAQWVAIDVPGYLPEDSWMHLPPGGERIVCLRPDPAAQARGEGSPYGTVRALNQDWPVTIEVEEGSL